MLKHDTKPSLWRLLWRMYGGMFVLSGFLMMCSVMLQFAPPLLMRALLSYIEDGGEGHSTAYGYGIAALMLLTDFAFTVPRSPFHPLRCAGTACNTSTAAYCNSMWIVR